MAREIKAATLADQARVSRAIGHLRLARDLLAEARADKAAARVRLSITSAEGAGRHVAHRIRRTGDAVPPTPEPRNARRRATDAGLRPMESLANAVRFVADCALARDAELLDYLGEPDLALRDLGIFRLRTEFGPIFVRVAFTQDEVARSLAAIDNLPPSLPAAVGMLASADLSPWPGLRDAIPWEALEEAAAGLEGTCALSDLAKGAGWDALASGDASGELFCGTGWSFADQEHAQSGGWELERLGDGLFIIRAPSDSDIFMGGDAADKACEHVRGLADPTSEFSDEFAEHYKPDYLDLCRRAWALCNGEKA